MTSIAERKRRKRTRNMQITLAGGQVAQMRERAGKGKRTDMAEQDATATVIEARTRQLAALGCAAPILARTDMAGCAVGIRLLLDGLAADHRAELWSAIKHMRRVWVSYDRAIGAPNRHPQCLRVLTPAETMTASASDPAYDDRSEEERYRAAINAYMAVHGWLGYTDGSARSACIAAVVDDKPITNWDGIKRALCCISDGMAGRKVVYRGA